MNFHKEVASPELATLLEGLMGDEGLRDFHLVGGTALALRFGHRVSVDIDLFSVELFDSAALAEHLGQAWGMTEGEALRNTVRGIISGIKVDCITHAYPLLGPVERVAEVRMASLADLAAMKVNAIANRGGKKDFWDLAELLRHFSVDELLAFVQRKYQGDSVWNARKSLCYFVDAEEDPPPRDLRGMGWEEVKSFIVSRVALGSTSD